MWASYHPPDGWRVSRWDTCFSINLNSFSANISFRCRLGKPINPRYQDLRLLGASVLMERKMAGSPSRPPKSKTWDFLSQVWEALRCANMLQRRTGSEPGWTLCQTPRMDFKSPNRLGMGSEAKWRQLMKGACGIWGAFFLRILKSATGPMLKLWGLHSW